MLDKETLEWLERRQNLCTHCYKREYCRSGNRHNFNTVECRFWEPLAPGSRLKNIIYDFQDAAEFEARVAEYMSHRSNCTVPECTLERDLEDGLQYCRPYTEHGIKCAECRLKSARIIIESQMDSEGKGQELRYV